MPLLHNLQEIKTALRQGPYAWPGGYPTYFITTDGAALSHEAVREMWRDVVESHLFNLRHSGWHIAGVDVNWEEPDLICEHTGKPIPSAYGDESEDSDDIPQTPLEHLGQFSALLGD